MSALPPPQNPEIEQATLGSILIDGTAISQVLEILDPDDFYRDAHKKIFHAMVELDQASEPIDTLSLFEYMKAKGQLLEEVGGSGYLMYLPEVVPSATNVAYYAQKVKEDAQKRKLLNALEKGAYELREGKITPDEILERMCLLDEQVGVASLGASRLKPIPASELPDLPPCGALWGDLVYPESLVQINAEPGIGKTTLIQAWALHGSLNKEFLHVPFSKPLKVLYGDLETPNWKRLTRLRNMLNEGESFPESLHFLDDLSLARDYEDLLLLCKREAYDVVIFDTQSRVLALKDENDNAVANKALSKLRRLGRETMCAIILIHHTPIGERKGVYSGRGASAIAGGVDVVVKIEALDEDTLKIITSKNNLGGILPPLFVTKVGEDRFEVAQAPDGTESGFAIFEVQSFIMNLFTSDVTQHLETQYIRSKTELKGFAWRTAQRAVGRLVQAGKLYRVKRGVYGLSAKAPPPIYDGASGANEIPEHLRGDGGG